MSFSDEFEAPPPAPSPFLNVTEIPFPFPVMVPLVNALGEAKRLPPPTRDFLSAAKTCRDKVVSALSSLETADPDLLIENCQAYARISAQLAATQTAGLMIEAFPLTSDEFVWTSRLAVGERGGNWSNPYVSFESLFTFVATAAANMHKACVIVYNLTPSDDTGPMFMEAAKLYRTAAGYLEYAVANVVPSLRARGGAAKYPSEVQSPVLQAIAILCLAQAQHCAILKSIADGKPVALLAKLEAGAASLYGDALRTLNTLPADDFAALNPSIVSYIRSFALISSAMSWRHLGEEQYAKMEMANALAYMNKAQGTFARLGGGLSSVSQSPTGATDLPAQVADIKRLQEKYSTEALNVYFVDAAKDVPDAAPAIVVKSIPLEWPVLSPLPLPDSTAVVSPPVEAPTPAPVSRASSSDSVPSSPVAPAPQAHAPAPAAAAAGGGGPAPTTVISCTHCRSAMHVQIGIPAVKCPSCTKVTRFIKCKQCAASFAYPDGTNLVQCPSCNTVTDTRTLAK